MGKIFRLKVKVNKKRWAIGLNDYTYEQAVARQQELKVVGIESQVIDFDTILN